MASKKRQGPPGGRLGASIRPRSGHISPRDTPIELPNHGKEAQPAPRPSELPFPVCPADTSTYTFLGRRQEAGIFLAPRTVDGMQTTFLQIYVLQTKITR